MQINDGKQSVFQVLKSFRWMKNADMFKMPVRIGLTHKNLFDRGKRQTKMFKGSIYGGFLTIITMLILVVFFMIKFREMFSG